VRIVGILDKKVTIYEHYLLLTQKRNCHWRVLLVLATCFGGVTVSIMHTLYIQCAQILNTAFQEAIISLSLHILKEKGWGMQGSIKNGTEH